MKFDRRLVIMITDLHGSKYINVDMIFKQLSAYVLVFILTLGLFIYASITIINKEIEETKNRNNYLLKEFADMQKHNQHLNKVVQEKDEEIALVGDKFETIESVIGVKKDDVGEETLLESDDFSLMERMDTTSISALQKSFIMKFIPNGKPLDIELRISGPYGKRYHPILKIYHIHTGIDMATPMNTPVYATADGVIDWASNSGNGGYGKLVKISHAFGFRTYYAHLNDIKVQRGEFVKKGQLVALSGSTGTSTGPHLHYEIRFLGQPIDPINFIQWDMQNFNSIFEKERRISWLSLLEIINNLMGRKQEQLQSSPQIQDSRGK
ncbi:peptidase [Helicobacter didelphidarum]|uniref:Peptidase n=1 Tax=Helicobacter didelphidarum TaxID=2040648 RepID=A0A3D8IP00_9HELI|nr:M23 family metallopeptidase [Helicobacter didelphidarum]RDU66710.1 peptidase [Helicobacter didelphidarum]